ncbi:MAG: iron-containing alcohol dehydrogenase [Rhodospirillales bacterium]|jgi:alcohol dehydrogenase class IV|nr:iron-containing alcohol dehydrogenase [Rhodospirillales bacterium]
MNASSIDPANLVGNWNYPTTIKFGAGRISELPAACADQGMSNPLIITDPGLRDLPMTTAILDSFKIANIKCGLFSDIKPNPVGSNVEDGVKAYKAGGHDGVVAYGGGSGLDAAKAVALMVGQDLPIWDFEDVGDNWTRVIESGVAKIIAVPTTSGTGSEVGRASVITNEEEHLKKIIFHPLMVPAIVIADPELTIGLPAKITAATGMDALSHNLEAFCAPGFHPMARGIAVEGMLIIKDWLLEATNNGSNVAARSMMMAASTMGATAFQRGLGGMHALAHPLGATFDLHHGLLNAIVMPYILWANKPAIEDDLAYLGRCLGIGDNFEAVVDWVLTLRSDLGIPNDLAAIGVSEECVEAIGAKAINDPSAGGNPIQFTAGQYTEICRKAVLGIHG